MVLVFFSLFFGERELGDELFICLVFERSDLMSLDEVEFGWCELIRRFGILSRFKREINGNGELFLTLYYV